MEFEERERFELMRLCFKATRGEMNAIQRAFERTPECRRTSVLANATNALRISHLTPEADQLLNDYEDAEIAAQDVVARLIKKHTGQDP